MPTRKKEKRKADTHLAHCLLPDTQANASQKSKSQILPAHKRRNVNRKSKINLGKEKFSDMSFNLRKNSTFAVLNATLAQLVRVPDCGSGGHGFEPHRWYIKNSSAS